MLRYGSFCILLFALVLQNAISYAQSVASKSGTEYPARPVRLIVPFPPGGSDTVARLIAQRLQDRLGQQFVVDNRAGAAGVVGTSLAAKAPADGYTLVFITASLTITPNPQKTPLPFDLARDFDPVSPIAGGPLLVLVHPSIPAKSIAELIALSKSKAGSLNYASSGTGSITHLAAELFRSQTNADLTHIPYKGTGPAQVELMAGQVQVMFGILAPALPHVHAGKLRALGVTSSKRSLLAPDIPTVVESGVKGYEAATWYGILAPAGTPEPPMQKVREHIAAILSDTEVTSLLLKSGFEPTAPMSSKEFRTYIRAEMVKWSDLVKRTGIKLE